MVGTKNSTVRQVNIRAGTAKEFFARGRRLAKRADEGAPIPAVTMLSFEDPAELAALLTPARITLVRAVQEEPGSLTAIAQRLRRDRSAVKRDVDALEAAGLVIVVDKVLPGHGRMKEVRAAARRLSLRADLA